MKGLFDRVSTGDDASLAMTRSLPRLCENSNVDANQSLAGVNRPSSCEVPGVASSFPDLTAFQARSRQLPFSFSPGFSLVIQGRIH